MVAVTALSAPISPTSSVAYADTVSEARDEWNRLREEAEGKADDLVTAKAKVAEAEQSVADVQAELDGIESELSEARGRLAQIVSDEYKNPTEPTLDAVLGVSSLAELAEIHDYHDRVMRMEQAAVEEVSARTHALEDAKARLEQEVAELNATISEQEDALAAAQAAEDEAKEHYASLSDEARREIAEADIEDRARAREMADKLEGDVLDGDGVSGSVQNLVERAYSIIGSGYSWSGYWWTGDTGSSAFTCSGVVDYALGRGSQSSSPETLYAEVGSNMVYDTSQLNYGDLVFYAFDGRYPTGHTGIYVGNGMIIDSIPSGGVQLRDVNYMDFVGGGPIL